MNKNYIIINETDYYNSSYFPSKDYFNAIYLYRNKYAIAEFNQKFAGSIILKTKYYNSIDECINSYNIIDDNYFTNIIVKYNLN